MTNTDIKGYFPAEEVEFKSIGRGDRYVDYMNRLGWCLMVMLAITILAFPVHPVVGSSMNPTYVDGQEALCTRICIGEFQKGDVVIANAGGKLLIKRVIACPGDSITIHPDGSVSVNGKTSEYGTGSSYLSGGFAGLSRNADGSYSGIMGDNEYYLLGDNRENSADSRYYGPFYRSRILQKVMCVI